MSPIDAVQTETRAPSLIAVSDQTPPIQHPSDAEVDIYILKTIPKQFCVEDQNSANWVIKKIVAARQYAANVKLWAELELRRAEREEHTMMFLFGRQLETWVRGEIAQFNGKRKSLALPAGTVGFRKVASKLVIDDEKVVIVWAKENCPQAVVTVTTEKLMKSLVDEYTEKTGVIPDSGVHVEPEAERFYLK